MSWFVFFGGCGFGEFFFMDGGGVWCSSFVFQYGVGSGVGVQLYSVDGVVVVWDCVVDQFWVVVGVDDSDYWDVEFFGFFDGDVFVVDVDDEDCVWQMVYVFDVVQ